jgi:FAD/FMN-containing dehydrogenase
MYNETNYLEIKNELLNKIKGEIDIGENILEKYSTDASLFRVNPQMVIYPKDKNDIVAIVKFVNENKYKYKDLSITVRAAGTDMSGGPLNNSIILDTTKYLNNIIDIGEQIQDIETGERKYFAVCQPGLYYRDLEKQSLKFDLVFPSYPASKDLCAIGGIISNNSAGEKTLYYGQTIKYIHELEVILSNGEIVRFNKISKKKAIEKSKKDSLEGKIYRNILEILEKNKDEIKKAKPKTSKNASGYNLWEVEKKNERSEEFIEMQKLIVGSQGTLGIVTEVTLELVKVKKNSRMLVAFLPNFNNIVEVTKELLLFKPESLESYDDKAFSLAMKYLPAMISKINGNYFKMIFGFLPEVFMVLTGGVPKFIILAEFTGDNEKEVNRKIKDAYKVIKKFGYKVKYTTSNKGAEKYWLFRRESFNLLRTRLKGMRSAPYIEDTSVPVESLKEFIPAMQNILEKNNLTYSIQGHVGDGNFHIFQLTTFKGGKGQNEISKIEKVMHQVFALVKYFGGSISAEHNDGLIRTPFLDYMFNKEILNLFKQVKNIFDPKNIFNPGKKVGGSIEENFKLIDRTK